MPPPQVQSESSNSRTNAAADRESKPPRTPQPLLSSPGTLHEMVQILDTAVREYTFPFEGFNRGGGGGRRGSGGNLLGRLSKKVGTVTGSNLALGGSMNGTSSGRRSKSRALANSESDSPDGTAANDNIVDPNDPVALAASLAEKEASLAEEERRELEESVEKMLAGMGCVEDTGGDAGKSKKSVAESDDKMITKKALPAGVSSENKSEPVFEIVSSKKNLNNGKGANRNPDSEPSSTNSDLNPEQPKSKSSLTPAPTPVPSPSSPSQSLHLSSHTPPALKSIAKLLQILTKRLREAGKPGAVGSRISSSRHGTGFDGTLLKLAECMCEM